MWHKSKRVVNRGRAKDRNKDIKEMNRERRKGKVKIQRDGWRYGSTCGELATVFVRRGVCKTSYSAINVLVYITSENMEIPLKPCAFFVNMPLISFCTCHSPAGM
jgi:hypothetical protein